MPEQPIKDKTAIVGLGWTAFTRNSGTTVDNLAAEACLMAIEDAGLAVGDIDGVVTFSQENDTISPRELAEMIGMPHCDFNFFHNGGGSWSAASVLSAAMLVHAGVCTTVLVYRAKNGYTEGRAAHASRPRLVSGPDQFVAPFGSSHAAARFGHYATAHMARYGTTSLDFAHLAVTQRRHAMLNKKAMMRKPMTIEDHQNSRWIIYPFRLFDCCQQTDGAVALVVTSTERARDLRHKPVYIMAGMGGSIGAGGRGEVEGPWETRGAYVAPLLFEGAGVTAQDVSFAEIYDPFTHMCLTHIEDFGFVPKGQAGAWVREGHNALDGSLPVNTHGGLLSEAHIHGLNHVIEAVQQLRPEGVVDDLCEGPHTYDRSVCRQVRAPEIGLVCSEGCGSAILLRKG